MNDQTTYEQRRVLVTDAASEPVTRDELKDHARVLDTTDDDYIDDLIAATRQAFEGETAIALINQTWRAWFDRPALQDTLGWWDGVRQGAIGDIATDHLRLLPAPVSSISSIKSYDLDGTETVFSADNYFLDTVSRPARVVLNAGKTWPVSLRNRNALAVEFVAGYGADASDVPFDIRHALKVVAAHRYEHRGDVLSPNGVNALVQMLRPTIERYKLRVL